AILGSGSPELRSDDGFSMIVPLVARGRTVGALSFARVAAGRRYTQTNLEVAESLARTAALTVDNAQLLREAQRSAAELDALLARELLPRHDAGRRAARRRRGRDGHHDEKARRGRACPTAGAARVSRRSERAARVLARLRDDARQRRRPRRASPRRLVRDRPLPCRRDPPRGRRARRPRAGGGSRADPDAVRSGDRRSDRSRGGASDRRATADRGVPGG